MTVCPTSPHLHWLAEVSGWRRRAEKGKCVLVETELEDLWCYNSTMLRTEKEFFIIHMHIYFLIPFQ